jgi:hypothetical protein
VDLKTGLITLTKSGVQLDELALPRRQIDEVELAASLLGVSEDVGYLLSFGIHSNFY